MGCHSLQNIIFWKIYSFVHWIYVTHFYVPSTETIEIKVKIPPTGGHDLLEEADRKIPSSERDRHMMGLSIKPVGAWAESLSMGRHLLVKEKWWKERMCKSPIKSLLWIYVWKELCQEWLKCDLRTSMFPAWAELLLNTLKSNRRIVAELPKPKNNAENWTFSGRKKTYLSLVKDEMCSTTQLYV